MATQTYPNIYKVPVGRMAVIGAILAEGGQPSPVLEGDALDCYGLEELGQDLVLGEIGLRGGRDSRSGPFIAASSG